MEVNNQFLLFCNYNGPRVVIKISEVSAFEYVLSTIIGNWKELLNKSVELSYSIPGHDYLRLANDDDLDSLKTLAGKLRCDEIEILVKDRDHSSADIYGNGKERNSEVAVQHNLESFDRSEAGCGSFNEPDSLSSYCVHEEKQYLSSIWRGLIRGVGQLFVGGVQQFRKDLSKYSIEVGYRHKFLKNDSERVTAVCMYDKERECMWRVHARRNTLNGYFYIKELNNVHTCGSTVRTLKNKRMSSDIVAGEILDDVRRNPLLSPIEIKKRMKTTHGLEITYNHAWRGVEKAKNRVYGDHTMSYDYLNWYIEQTSLTNPGSAMSMEYNSKSGNFKRFFVSFEACITGFNFCRPMLFLDGTHLQGKYKGNLLAATGKDANGGLFHLAFAIVDAEDEDNWRWFLLQLKEIISERRTITFISDRNKGLLEAVSTVFPDGHHAFCLRHLQANLKDKLHGSSKEFKERMLSMLNYCAYTPKTDSCQWMLSKLKDEGKGAVVKFLEGAPIESWCNAYFKGRRYGEMTSNAAESFNSWIRVARSLPVLNLVDTIREQLMTDFTKCRRHGMDMKGVICTNFDDKIQELIEIGRSWDVNESSEYVYEVKSVPSVVVNIEDRTCGCFKWQLNRFPCEHAVAVIQACNLELLQYIEDYFHVELYRLTYAKSISPVPTLGKPVVRVEDIVVLPPRAKRQAGRPRKNRFKRNDENARKVAQITCGRCGMKGHHNKKTCKFSLC